MWLNFFLMLILVSTSLLGTEKYISWPIENLKDLELILKDQMRLIGFDESRWKRVPRGVSTMRKDDYDVVIIGGGMSGLSAALALAREGIKHLTIYDDNPEGKEGPWLNYACNKNLRSSKKLVGAALDIPLLTLEAWYTASYGREAWDELGGTPKEIWMEYLKWYRQIFEIPVQNDTKLISLTPSEDNGFLLELSKNGDIFWVKSHKVIIANGRKGYGGPFIPNFAKSIPQNMYSHVYNNIDYQQFKEKDIGIIGVGASAFDAASTALEAGAKSVKILYRKQALPNARIFSDFSNWIYHIGFYGMDDDWKFDAIAKFKQNGIPAHINQVLIVQNNPRFKLFKQSTIKNLTIENGRIQVTLLGKRNLEFDHLILATGASIDGRNQPELKSVIDCIDLWKYHVSESQLKQNYSMGEYPYLGPSFEFLEKYPGQAPYLKNLYCFNVGSALSHGILTAEIPGMSGGADRLAKGIAIDFFKLSYKKLFGEQK